MASKLGHRPELHGEWQEMHRPHHAQFHIPISMGCIFGAMLEYCRGLPGLTPALAPIAIRHSCSDKEQRVQLCNTSERDQYAGTKMSVCM